MNHITRQTLAFTAGIAAVAAIGIGGVALAQGNDDPSPAKEQAQEQTTDREQGAGEGQAARHDLADVTFLIECNDDNLVSQPEMLTVTCADGNANLSAMEWSDWGADEATAVGDLVVNTCDPTCADGTLETYPVRVTAGDLVRGEASQSYGSLTLHFTGNVPEGFDQDEVLPQLGVEPMGVDLSQ